MRALSGIKPTGSLHIGNYFGAARQFEEFQKKNYEGFYFIADYHTLNSHPEPSKLVENTRNIALDYLAFGLDPQKSTLFLQSHVPEVVELAFILSNYTPMGLMQRAHSYKDKVAKNELINVGLFYYPLLMTADILAYKSNIVPVGKDQKQHVEIARDIAEKFNLHYQKELFTIPDPYIPENVATVPGTDGQKMSKSYQNTIEMFADAPTLKKQIMGIVTDSTPLEEPKDPDTNNVFNIYKLFVDKAESDEMSTKLKAGGYGYGHAKKELLEAVHSFFDPMRKKREELAKNIDYVQKVLKEGGEKARAVATQTLEEVKKTIGLSERFKL
ncbi:MAG: tryptophan--tRNA ligase [bacterium]